MNCNTESLQRDGSTTHIRSEKNSHEREHCVALHSTIPFRVSGNNRQLAAAGSEETYQVQPNICHQNLIFLILRERVEKEMKSSCSFTTPVDSTWMKSKQKVSN